MPLHPKGSSQGKFSPLPSLPGSGVNIVKFIINFENFATKNFVFILLVLSSIEAGIPIGVHLLSPASLALTLLGPLLLIIFCSRIKGTLFQKLPLILPLLAFTFIIFLSMQASADHAIAVRFSAKYFAQILTFLGFLLYFQSKKNEGKQIFIKGIIYFSLLNGIVNLLEKLSLPSVAIILMSGYLSAASFPDEVSRDIDGFLSKPFTTDEIRSLVSLILVENKGRRA